MVKYLKVNDIERAEKGRLVDSLTAAAGTAASEVRKHNNGNAFALYPGAASRVNVTVHPPGNGSSARMPDTISFLNTFARLVWSIVHRPDDVEVQKAGLRALAVAARSRSFRVALSDVRARMSELSGVVGGGDETAQLSMLAQQMTSHSVTTLEFLRDLRAADVLGVGRALASAPVKGDDGAAFDALMVSLVPTTVSVSLGPTGFVRQATPPMGLRAVRPATTPPHGIDAAPNGGGGNVFAPAPAQEKRRDDSKTMIESAIMRHAHSRSLDDLFIRLRGPLAPDSAPQLIEELCRAAEDYANEGVWIGVLDVIERLMERESSADNPALARAFAIQYRRLSKTGILNGLAQLLPHRREAKDAVHLFMKKMGVPAADVLVDLLVTSDKAADRRAYRDAILECPETAGPLIHLLGDHRWFVVRNAAELLGDMKVEEAEERLVDVLAHIDSRCRRSATHALGRIASKRALHAIAQRMTDPDSAVRLQATLGVGASRNPRAVPLLLEALKRESEPEIQAALLSALGKAPTPEAVERLSEEARPGPLLGRRSQSHRLAALQALGEAGTHEARMALRRFIADRDREVKALAERLLRETAHELAVG
ncbi:MAG: HEAT repeat domain-containing protein [Gemmatimonadota bacterium]